MLFPQAQGACLNYFCIFTCRSRSGIYRNSVNDSEQTKNDNKDKAQAWNKEKERGNRANDM